MKLLTANLTGKPLDWALAVALRRNPECKHGQVWVSASPSLPNTGIKSFYHTDPALCLELTKQINIMQQANDGSWRVAAFCVNGKKHKGYGKTLAEAVALCVVAMHLGDRVDVPDELCEEQANENN